MGFLIIGENDLHSFGKRTVLRSELCGKGSRITLEKTEFLKPWFCGYTLNVHFYCNFSSWFTQTVPYPAASYLCLLVSSKTNKTIKPVLLHIAHVVLAKILKSADQKSVCGERGLQKKKCSTASWIKCFNRNR